jgi:hypothetical protein
MKVVITDTFIKSFEKMINRQRWYWKIWDFFRYDLPQGIKNIILFWRVVWNYRSWDSRNSLQIFSHSLKLLSKGLEEKSLEVDSSRLKKIAKLNRAIEILDRQASDTYLEYSESKLGYKVNTEYGIFSNKEEEEPLAIKEANQKIFDLSNSLEEGEWLELMTILKGQNHSQFVMLYDKAKSENGENTVSDDLWDNWFDGSGLKSWWY